MREHQVAADGRHHRRIRRPAERRWQIPIVDPNRRIVGWTGVTPITEGAALSHPESEAILGGPVTCTYVQINDTPSAQRAGAPAGWNEPWRCLALIKRDIRFIGSDSSPLVDVAP